MSNLVIWNNHPYPALIQTTRTGGAYPLTCVIFKPDSRLRIMDIESRFLAVPPRFKAPLSDTAQAEIDAALGRTAEVEEQLHDALRAMERPTR